MWYITHGDGLFWNHLACGRWKCWEWTASSNISNFLNPSLSLSLLPHQNYIARFGHGSAKLARQAQSKEKTLQKMVASGLTESVKNDQVSLFSDFDRADCAFPYRLGTGALFGITSLESHDQKSMDLSYSGYYCRQVTRVWVYSYYCCCGMISTKGRIIVPLPGSVFSVKGHGDKKLPDKFSWSKQHAKECRADATGSVSSRIIVKCKRGFIIP